MLKSLRLRNFKNFDREDFTFSPGLNFIHGANGTGKSTIIQGITFAMWGPNALPVDREQVVRWEAVGDATAQLIGELFSDEFDVKRHLSGQVQLGIPGEQPLKRSIDVAKYFGNVFIDLKTFMGTCACYQKDTDKLASQKPAERRDFISKVLCLNVVNDCISTISEESKHLKAVDLLYMKSLIEDLEKAQRSVKNVDLTRVNEAYNLLQDLERVKGKNPAGARKKLQRVLKQLEKLEQERSENSTLCSLYQAALRSDLSKCPVCRADLEEDMREELKMLLPNLSEQNGKIANKIADLRTDMIGLQAEGGMLDPNELQRRLDATGIPDPVNAFEGIRHYETLKAQLELLQRDLPEHKTKKFKEELKQLFRDFREYVLIPYFGVINFVMTEYLTTNTQFSKFTLHEDYSVTVDDKPITAYSGGQVDLICTLFRLAAARVLAELRYGKLPFMLFDSFADSLDDNNFGLVMHFLQTQLPNVDQVIITAHHNVSIPGAYRINL